MNFFFAFLKIGYKFHIVLSEQKKSTVVNYFPDFSAGLAKKFGR